MTDLNIILLIFLRIDSLSAYYLLQIGFMMR